MKEYHKIETLWKFDPETKKFKSGFYRNQTIERLKDIHWVFTQKIDGTNFRIYWDGHKLAYGGRTDKAVFNKTQIEFIEKELVNETQEIIFEQMFGEKEVYVFGELFGAGIQKGSVYNSSLLFSVFDVKVGDFWLEDTEMREVANELGYIAVPMLLVGKIEDAIKYVEKVDFTEYYPNAPLEGLVGRPVGGFHDRLGKRIIVKIKKCDLGS